MVWLSRKPAPPLDRFVVQIWYVEQPPLPHRFERLMPTPGANLIINLSEDRSRSYDLGGRPGMRESCGSILVGPVQEHFAIDTAEEQHVIGVQFHPAGAYAFFAVPMMELAYVDTALGDLWPADGKTLRERLCACATPSERIALLEAELLRHLRFTGADEATWMALRHLARGQRVEQVAEALGLTTRRLTTIFAQKVGLSPKSFARICRFQRVLRAVHHSSDVCWSDLALSAGYYDQAHLIHDFRRFSGFSPLEYVSRKGEHLNHVPLQS